MPQCCVPLCFNRFESKKTTRLSFHRFPSDEKERAKWLQVIGRENFTPNCNSRVCSWHFPNGKAAGPTRFAWNEKTFQVSASVSEMSSEAESLEVKSVAEGKDEVRAHKAMTDKPDDVGQLPKKSALQPLMLSPDLLSGHGEFGCTICGERCFSLAQLAKHVQFHDRDRPFPCAICGKRFLSRSHHAEHQRVHTGERPFPCNRCERAFTTHHNLKRHQLIHDKEEMYRCSVCGVLFCQEHQLGNIGGIIRVLKQHNMEDLIDPQQLLEPESVPEAEPAVETIPNLSLKTILKEEQNVRKKKRKHENLHSDEDHSPFADREGKNSQLSFHSEVPQIHTSEEKDFSDLVRRTGPRIQKIAYDIEIIL
ncbi:zinc finger protein 2-like isoform X1 [Colossoma macropomum]|uniref:zinc finger protein 2-like isoform X1 n=1 Tax=Colossoma macropomum TaxID=42526 RepID=UPI0018644281|nr:zinc finger protein 2-like isoform X1 [Colossoma macropomum]